MGPQFAGFVLCFYAGGPWDSSGPIFWADNNVPDLCIYLHRVLAQPEIFKCKKEHTLSKWAGLGLDLPECVMDLRPIWPINALS